MLYTIFVYDVKVTPANVKAKITVVTDHLFLFSTTNIWWAGIANQQAEMVNLTYKSNDV